MNEFDQFMKHKLKARYYIRYADDFIVLSRDESWLESMILAIRDYLSKELKLSLHPHKVTISTLASGIDFLGWVHFPDHRVLRTVAKRRMLKNIAVKLGNIETVQSYLGLLKHGNTYKLKTEVINLILLF